MTILAVIELNRGVSISDQAKFLGGSCGHRRQRVALDQGSTRNRAGSIGGHPVKAYADLMRTARQLLLFFLLLIRPVASISAESDQQLAAKIAGIWVGREIIYYSDVEVHTTYRADGTMTRLAKFSDDRRRYKLSVQGRWKVERGQLVTICQSFTGPTEDSVDDIIAVTENMLLLRAEDGRLIHYIRR
ncbi:MAG TPA: hypothetical protein VE860_06755 [Chthoniobacterales bacterium]|nr:hypothetical protein [Chthoniobacterales bacterium]